MPPPQEQTGRSTKELSPAANATAVWFRHAARALKMFRLYRGEDNAVSTALRDTVSEGLERILAAHGNLNLRFTASEIWVGDETVVRPMPTGIDGVREPVETLPFLFYRDGIRRLQILQDVTREEIVSLLRALTTASVGPHAEDDLVTLLWQGNLRRILIETVPLEQTIHLSVRRPTGGGETGVQGQTYLLNPGGSEIRAELGQQAGPQGLHRDTFDDWPLPERWPDARASWEASCSPMEAALELFLERCRIEQDEHWTVNAAPVARLLARLDGSEAMRYSLVYSAITWLTGALQRCAWDEAEEGLTLLRELDPQHGIGDQALAAAVAALDHALVTESLDEGAPSDHSHFAAIVVAIGKPALDIAIKVMANSDKVRVRAAACAALTWLCADEPELLRPYVEDTRWVVVRNTVFILGQIGGEAVVPLLRLATHHPEPRVRRMVVMASGNVPRAQRLDLLTGQLDASDPQLLSAALNMLTREKSARVARVVLDRIERPDFDSRAAENQRALFSALAEVADDSLVGPLETLLHKGGWFARRSLERIAVARTLRHIGSERALAVLEAGLRSRIEAVRSACYDALSSRMAA
jgi:HEAT repeat protein